MREPRAISRSQPAVWNARSLARKRREHALELFEPGWIAVNFGARHEPYGFADRLCRR